MGTLQENQSLNAEYERNKKEREMKEEIERLQTIIKEVREYIESNKIYTNEKQEAYTLKNTWYGLELLEILDKENI